MGGGGRDSLHGNGLQDHDHTREEIHVGFQAEQRVFEQTGVQLEPEVRILGADEQKKEESV